MRRIKFLGIFRYKRITYIRPEDQNAFYLTIKNNYFSLDFALLEDHVNICLKNSSELKRLWTFTVIRIVVSALGTVSEGLVKWLKETKIRDSIKTIKSTALKKIS